MVSKRDRLIKLIDYIKTFGIEVNFKKNLARGNKGFFKVVSDNYRIDISRKISDEDAIRVLVHEFIHYVHYKNDKKLKSLEFIFDNYDADSELIEITVDSISKSDVKPLFDRKIFLCNEIKNYSTKLKTKYIDFKINKPFIILENNIKKSNYKYLLKHDNVVVRNIFGEKKYSIYDMENLVKVFSEEELNYIKLKSMQRELKRINLKISKFNKYYNNPTELLARSFEYFIFSPNRMQKLTPNLYKRYEGIIKMKKNTMISELVEILKS